MRLYEFIINLFEYKREITLQKLGDRLLQAAQQDQKQSAEQVILSLENIDPTTNKQYVLWLANQYIKGQFKVNDASTVNQLLVDFEKLKPRLPVRDINRFDYNSLTSSIEEILLPDSNSKSPTEIPGAEVLYQGPLGQLTRPLTIEASCKLGSGTKWCTSARESNKFAEYSSNGQIYIWKDKTGKYQFFFDDTDENFEFRDDQNNHISDEKLQEFRKHPVLKKLFKMIEEKIIENERALTAVYYASEIIKEPWPAAENLIASNPDAAVEYAVDVIGGKWAKGEPSIINLGADHVIEIYRELAYGGNQRWPAYESFLLKSEDPYNDGQFIHYLKTLEIPFRSPKFEEKLIKSGDTEVILDYLSAIRTDDFTEVPEFIPIFAKKADTAYEYAYNVRRGRFPEGESIIATSPEFSFNYARNILQKPFPAGEDSIAQDPSVAINYAYYVLKDRFKKAEPLIRENPRFWGPYVNAMNKLGISVV